MNWQQEVYIDYNRVKNKIENGYRFLVNENKPDPSDVDSDLDEYLYDLIGRLNIENYYHVGFNMGRTLISVSRLHPKIIVGGITWFDNSVAFGQQLFNLSDHRELELQIGEYPYKPIAGVWDFINLGRLPDKSKLGREILEQACKDTTKYVFFFASPGQVKAFDDSFECKQDFDSGLEFVPILLTKIEDDNWMHHVNFISYPSKKDETNKPKVFDDGIIDPDMYIGKEKSDRPRLPGEKVEFPLDLLRPQKDDNFEGSTLMEDGTIYKYTDEEMEIAEQGIMDQIIYEENEVDDRPKLPDLGHQKPFHLYEKEDEVDDIDS